MGRNVVARGQGQGSQVQALDPQVNPCRLPSTSFATLSLPAADVSTWCNTCHWQPVQVQLQQRPGRAPPQPVFEIGALPLRRRSRQQEAHRQSPPDIPFMELVVRRPVALLARVPRGAVLFTAGAVAGAIGKTLTAPLDRVKLLLQTRGGLQTGALKAAARSGGVLQSLAAIGKEEGLLGYWKGNTPQVLRVIPYSAVQLYSYEVFKRLFRDEQGQLTLPRRLAAGGCAGMTATLATYPLDMLRFRLAVDPKARSIAGATRALLAEGGGPAFFRGLGASLLGIAPYMALELGSFDLIPEQLPPFARGFAAALLATSICYPLDTVRRRIQMQTGAPAQVRTIVRAIWQQDGLVGFYRGFVPNALKNLPNKGIKLGTFDAAKKLVTTSEAAYADELAKQPIAGL